MELTQYQSHKRVHAAQISKVLVDGKGVVYGLELDVVGKFDRLIFNSESNELLRKPKPEPGMWYVLYPDGYFSFHPENFLDEYAKVELLPAKITTLEQVTQEVKDKTNWAEKKRTDTNQIQEDTLDNIAHLGRVIQTLQAEIVRLKQLQEDHDLAQS
jgi:hypothetical protein